MLIFETKIHTALILRFRCTRFQQKENTETIIKQSIVLSLREMKGFLIQLHRSIFATLLCLIGLTIVNAQMTKYLTNQETINQLILQLSRMTLKDQPGVSRK